MVTKEIDTKGWTQAEEALAEVVLWGVAWAVETPTRIEARCHYHSFWNWVVLEVSPYSTKEMSCVLLQSPLVPTGLLCFRPFVSIVVLLLMMMPVRVEAPMAEDCPVCNSCA